jgi:hypothetical protein
MRGGANEIQRPHHLRSQRAAKGNGVITCHIGQRRAEQQQADAMPPRNEWDQLRRGDVRTE